MLILCAKAIGVLDGCREFISVYLAAPQLDADGQNASCRLLIAPLDSQENQIFGIDNNQAYSLAKSYISIRLEKYTLSTFAELPLAFEEMLPETLPAFLAFLESDADVI